MQLDTTNQITNYNRYHTRDIHTTVRTLSPKRKQRLLDQIQLQKMIYTLMGREFNHTDCERIETALRAKEKKSHTKDTRGLNANKILI